MIDNFVFNGAAISVVTLTAFAFIMVCVGVFCRETSEHKRMGLTQRERYRLVGLAFVLCGVVFVWAHAQKAIDGLNAKELFIATLVAMLVCAGAALWIRIYPSKFAYRIHGEYLVKLDDIRAGDESPAQYKRYKKSFVDRVVYRLSGGR